MLSGVFREGCFLIARSQQPTKVNGFIAQCFSASRYRFTVSVKLLAMPRAPLFRSFIAAKAFMRGRAYLCRAAARYADTSRYFQH